MSVLVWIAMAYLAPCCALGLYGIWPRPTGPVACARVVIVLGGGARNGALLAVGRARVAAAVAALGPEQMLHMTGGMAGGGSEAALMAAEATRLGVDPARITQEGYSRTTQQNAALSYDIVPDRTVVLVSDNFHLARAALLFRGQGYRVVGVRGTAYRRGWRRALWFFAREGLSAPTNLMRLLAWRLAGALGVSRAWRIRNLI